MDGALTEADCPDVLVIAGNLHPAVGGPASSVPADVRSLVLNGVRVCLAHATPSALAEGASKHLAERIGTSHAVSVESMPTISLPVRRSTEWGLVTPPGVQALSRLVRGSTLVHVQGVYGLVQVLGVVLSVLHRRPLVVTPREQLTTFDIRKGGWIKRLAKLAVGRPIIATARVAIFTSTLERGSSKVWRKNASVVWNSAEAPDKTGPRQAPCTRRVGFLGRNDPKKNLPLLLEAMTHLDSSYTLEIAGLTSAECRLPPDLVGRVSFAGPLAGAELEAYFARVDCLVMPSEYECFGNVAAEAMVRGVPVVVSVHSGVAEVIQRVGGGGLISTPSVAEIVNALKGIFGDPDEYEKHSKFGILDVAEALSSEQHGADLLAAYVRAINR